VCNNPGFFVFSNVNNGVPTSTCQRALERVMTARILNLLAANLAVTIVTSIGELILFTLLFKRIYAICCKKRIEERKLRQQK